MISDMGHWQQIGVENRIERERVARLPKWRRALVAAAALFAAGFALLVLHLLPYMKHPS